METGNIETRSHNQRAEDGSWLIWVRDKILPAIIISGILALLGGGYVMYGKIASVTDSMPKINAELESVRESIPKMNFEVKRLNDKIDTEFARMNDKQLRLEGDVFVLRSQMVGWDTMKRIEMQWSSASKEGKGNAAMAGVAAILRAEIEARKEIPQNDRR